MKKFRAICLFLLMVAVLMPLSVAVRGETAQNDDSVTNGCHSVNATRTLGTDEKLVETSDAVFVYERNSDTLLYQWNADATVYPSSMVKLMTALIALEVGDLQENVTVTRRALGYVAIGSVSAGLVAGEEISLEDLLYCLMVQSANDAAVVIAEHIAGSQEAFVDMMNVRAEELGCTGTHFSNAHGLHDEQSYTTARDVARILDAALENEIFRTMFETKNYTVGATNKSEARTVYTTNYMMSKEVVAKYYDARVTGGKTGATTEAGRCLAVTAEQDGMELLCIVMGADAEYEEDGLALKMNYSFSETTALLDHAFSGYEFRQVFYEDQVLKQYSVAGGANDVAVMPERALSTILPVGADTTSFRWVYLDSFGTVSAPVEAGQALSTVQVWYGDVCVAQTDLVAINSVKVWTEPTESRKEKDTSEDSDGTMIAIVIGCILGLVVLAVLALMTVRTFRRMLQKNRRRKRRANRRRNR